jgi:hypothetical protein
VAIALPQQRTHLAHLFGKISGIVVGRIFKLLEQPVDGRANARSRWTMFAAEIKNAA